VERLEKNVILGGFDHTEVVGMIGFYRQSGRQPAIFNDSPMCPIHKGTRTAGFTSEF
jgi:hypothetical protein